MELKKEIFKKYEGVLTGTAGRDRTGYQSLTQLVTGFQPLPKSFQKRSEGQLGSG